MWNLKFKQRGPCMESQRKQRWYKPLLKYRDERKVLPPSHTNFQKRGVFFTQELQIKRKPKKRPWLMGISSTPNCLCFQSENTPLSLPGALYDHCRTSPSTQPCSSYSSFGEGRSRGCRAAKVIPATQPLSTATARGKWTATPRWRFSTENIFRGSVQPFPKATTPPMHSAVSIISQSEGE